MTGRVVGGILQRVGRVVVPVSVRIAEVEAPACWRCGRYLYPPAVAVPSDEDAHPWVYVHKECMSDADRAARAAVEATGANRDALYGASSWRRTDEQPVTPSERDPRDAP